jgi:hypothetical protein
VAVLAGPAACHGGGKGDDSKAAASASSVPAPPAAPTTVRLSPQRSAVGEKTRSTRESALQMSVEFWQENEKLGSNDSSRKEEYTRTVEVLGLLGAVPAKVRVRYDHYHLVEVHPDKPVRDDTSLEGKTYVLDATEGKLVVGTPDGRKPPAEEASVLETLHGELGQDDPIVAALGADPIPVGEQRSMKDKLFRAFLSSTSGEYKAGACTLKGTRVEAGRDAAVFEWVAQLHTQEDNGLEVTWNIKGEAVVAIAPAVTLKSSISAALDLSGHTKQNGAIVQLVGAGSMKDDRRLTPL